MKGFDSLELSLCLGRCDNCSPDQETNDWERESHYHFKMFAELNNLLDIDIFDRYPSNKTFASLCEKDVSAIVLHHFVSFVRKSGRCLCLVAFQQTLSHYNHVSSKFGVNLHTADKSDFIYVDMMSYLKDLIMMSDSFDNETDVHQVGKLIYDKIFSAVSQVVDSTEVLLLVDDLAPLLAIGLRERDVLTLVHFLYAWHNSNRTSHCC